MSDDEDFVDVIDAEDDVDESRDPLIRVQAESIDVRRKLEAKLEEMRLRKMTQEYDF
jgi:hypothetical protein